MNHPKTDAPAVEPLSDIAWQRVERGLFAALDCDAAVAAPPPARRRAWAPWALAGAFAAAAAILVVVQLGRRPPPSPHAEIPATTPSRVVTEDARSEVSFGDALISAGASSALTMHGDAARGVLVVLERGSATFEVAPRAGRPPFVVQAGEVSVRVVGTRFTVSRSGDAARVDVAEGRVEVVARGHRAHVLAGDSWPSFDDREAVDRSTTDPSSVAVAPSSPDAAPTERATGRPSPRPQGDDRLRFEHAAALEASDAGAALREYRALARRNGPWAANALYAAARLAVELGDRRGAASMLRDYLARFPTGANAGNARSLLDSLAE